MCSKYKSTIAPGTLPEDSFYVICVPHLTLTQNKCTKKKNKKKIAFKCFWDILLCEKHDSKHATLEICPKSIDLMKYISSYFDHIRIN